MKQAPHKPQSQEIELKLWLPNPDPSALAKRLARTPVLARRKPSQQLLNNIYFDTPDQQLRQQQTALRLRCVDNGAGTKWLQTLKTGASATSALSRRGEWETPVAGARLERSALEATPWPEMDPDDRLFASLVPCFATVFQRTLWLVRRRDGGVVEVALDVGYLEADGRRAPICELELELKAGQPAALFDVARDIAATVAVLPASQSKAERGFLLAQGDLHQPLGAQPPGLSAKLPAVVLAHLVLREMFTQLTTNLNALRTSDDPELAHQARVGWRRFKSGLQLFRKILADTPPPSREALRPLLSCLSELRNLDVALTETLPPLAAAYAMGDGQRTQAWQAMMQALAQTTEIQRKAVRYALQEPTVGACLLAITQWLESLPATAKNAHVHKVALRHWAKRRVLRWNAQLADAQQNANTPEGLHRIRILAKRLRYGTQALRDLLPSQLAKQCARQATGLQTSIGATRDLSQAALLVAQLASDRGMVEFLRGVAMGSDLASGPTGRSPTIPR
jgi:inorganic triphosphatase YgiF